MRLFITGTDTGVGKTFATALLIRSLRRAGIEAVPFKPVVCGDREDVEILQKACDGALHADEINPIWYQNPLAPMAAASLEGEKFDLTRVLDQWDALCRKYPAVLVEGAGGWLVPISAHYTMADLASALQIPAMLVVLNRLGAVNHAMLTVRAIRAGGVEFAGWILNQPFPEQTLAEQTNRDTLVRCLGGELWLELSENQEIIPLEKLKLPG